MLDSEKNLYENNSIMGVFMKVLVILTFNWVIAMFCISFDMYVKNFLFNSFGHDVTVCNYKIQFCQMNVVPLLSKPYVNEVTLKEQK